MEIEIDKRVIFSKTIRKSLFNRNLRVKLKCTDRDLEIYDMHTFFGLFSTGDKRVNIPLRSIASFATERKINWLRSLFVFFFCMFTAFMSIFITDGEADFFPMLMLFLGFVTPIILLFLKDSYLVIYDNGGVRHGISVWFWDKNEILYLVNEINDVVSGK